MSVDRMLVDTRTIDLGPIIEKGLTSAKNKSVRFLPLAVADDICPIARYPFNELIDSRLFPQEGAPKRPYVLALMEDEQGNNSFFDGEMAVGALREKFQNPTNRQTVLKVHFFALKKWEGAFSWMATCSEKIDPAVENYILATSVNNEKEALKACNYLSLKCDMGKEDMRWISKVIEYVPTPKVADCKYV